MGVDVLNNSGKRAYTSRRAELNFLKKDEETMWQLAEHRHDREKYISVARARIKYQEEIMERERNGEEKPVDHAWDSEPLVKHFGER